GNDDFLHSTLQKIYSQGGTIFAAAGNEPTTGPVFPAAWNEVTAVTAGNRDGSIASYANRGSFVDVIAPGQAVVKANGEFFRVSGTSASTALVTGRAAATAAAKKK
ncbi:MAG: S8 family serine peptidase, partial [Limisphaerales bacterium]